jgi:hypothetical protein
MDFVIEPFKPKTERYEQGTRSDKGKTQFPRKTKNKIRRVLSIFIRLRGEKMLSLVSLHFLGDILFQCA